MKATSFFLLFLLCFVLKVKSDNSVDSLQKLLQSAPNDSQRVACLFGISGLLSAYDPAGSLKNAEQALAIAGKHNWKKETAKALNFIGNNYSIMGDVEKAIAYHRKALALSTAIKNDRLIAVSCYSLAYNYLKISDYREAQEYAYRALPVAERSGDKQVTYLLSGVIADIYMRTGKLDKALAIFKKMMSDAKKNNNATDIATIYGNIGLVYDYLDDFPNALANYSEQFRMAREIGNKRLEAASLGNIGSLYVEKREYKKALEYTLKCLEIKKEIASKQGIASAAYNVGSIYFELGEIAMAEKYCQMSLNLSREIKAPDTENVSLELLSYIYEKQGKLKDALSYYRAHVKIRDTILTKEKQADLTRRDLTYEFGKKAATDSIKALVEKNVLAQQNQVQALQLSRSRFVIYGFAGLSLLILVIAFLAIRQGRLKASQQTMQLEQKLLRSQMNPHFIFNSLIAIESFIYKNEPKEAGKYLSGFARLMRLILENSREEYVTLEKEIKTLEYYLELQKLRFEDKFTYTIASEEGIDAESIAVPPMLAQPFIENAIEHGIKNGKVKGEITIHFKKTGDQILFEVKDNGIGIEKAQLEGKKEKEHQSLATVITRERLSILNRRKSDKIRLFIDEIKDSLNNVLGTRVSFSIPFREI